MKTENEYQKRIEEALRDPKNLGELEGADAMGTAGSAACGDMIRLWIKFKEEAGQRVVDKATFQSFGCETAIAVASLATELIRGKTVEQVLALSAAELAPALGPLPPVKIHCSQLVESALHSALRGSPAGEKPQPAPVAPASLVDSLAGAMAPAGKLKVILLEQDSNAV